MAFVSLLVLKLVITLICARAFVRHHRSRARWAQDFPQRRELFAYGCGFYLRSLPVTTSQNHRTIADSFSGADFAKEASRLGVPVAPRPVDAAGELPTPYPIAFDFPPGRRCEGPLLPNKPYSHELDSICFNIEKTKAGSTSISNPGRAILSKGPIDCSLRSLRRNFDHTPCAQGFS